MQYDLAYTSFLETKKKNGLFRELVMMSHPDSRLLTVQGRDYINFSSNDYLALGQHPYVKERASEFAQLHGAGCGSSRLVTGNIELFDAIEKKLASLKSQPSALVFASGFQANASILQALFDKKVLQAEPLVFADRLNHASMHFGCVAAGVRQLRYRHLDTAHLAELLEKHAESDRPKFILTESVFSMDGDIADIPQLAELAKQYGCLLICDDAHATGILGEKGAGLSGTADITIGTFSKALGGFGAYLTCSDAIRDYIINRCSGFIYSTAPPPAVLGAMDAALDLLPELDAERAHVAGLAARLREELRQRGLDYGGSMTQIVPVILGETQKVTMASEVLRDNGIWATAIRPPTVPKGAARLRITFNAAHSENDLQLLVASLDIALGRI